MSAEETQAEGSDHSFSEAQLGAIAEIVQKLMDKAQAGRTAPRETLGESGLIPRWGG